MNLPKINEDLSQLGIDIIPDNVQNYQEKVEKLYSQLGHSTSLHNCCLLVILNESVLQNLPKPPKKLNGFFITINSKANTDFFELEKCIKKGISKAWIESGFYVYEQRSENPLTFSGFHCHLLLISNRKKYKADVINEWFSTCKKITTKNAINVKYVKRPCDYDNCYNYIKGNKTDKSKQKKQHVDLLSGS